MATADAPTKMFGQALKRREDPRLITGKGNYVGDLKLPGMHHVALVRSPYGHARIRGIDAKKALNHPGVVAVITGRDLPPLCGRAVIRRLCPTFSVVLSRDLPALLIL